MSRLDSRSQLTRLADFLFECGMLRKTPRSGYQFLGSGGENVAEHSFRTTVIGFVLAHMAGASKERTAMLCLFHDLPEARTGDFNYVNKVYDRCDPARALADSLAGTGLEGAVLPLHDELEEAASTEAKLAHDADQLDLMLNLKEESDLGNRYADKWLDAAKERLRTPQGQELGRVIMETDHADWWFLGPDQSWWERKGGKRPGAAENSGGPGAFDAPEDGQNE